MAFYDGLLQLDSVDGIEWWKLRMVDPRFDPIRKYPSITLDNIVIHGFVDKVIRKIGCLFVMEVSAILSEFGAFISSIYGS